MLVLVAVLVDGRTDTLKAQAQPLEVHQLVELEEVAEGEQDLWLGQRALNAPRPLVDQPLHLRHDH